MRKSILLKAVSWNYDTNDQAKESGGSGDPLRWRENARQSVLY